MAYCTVCGTELDENGICPRCAALADEAEDAGRVDRVVDRFQNANDETEDYDPADIEENKIFAVLSYLGILILVPIICRPASKFARFHISEAVDLIIFNFLYIVVATIVTLLCFKVGNALGILILGIFLVVFTISFVFWIIGISNAARGWAKEIPMIGKHKIMK